MITGEPNEIKLSNAGVTASSPAPAPTAISATSKASVRLTASWSVTSVGIECRRDFAADPTSGAGDNGDFAGQYRAHHFCTVGPANCS